MGNPANKEEKTEAQKVIEAVESYVTKAEELLQQLEGIREETLGPAAREDYVKKTEDYYRSWRKDVEAGVDTLGRSSQKVKDNCDEVLRYMDRQLQRYRNADTRELEQKRAEFAERITQLTAAPELPDLRQEVMQAFDTNLTEFDRATAEAQQKLQKLIAETGKELETLKKDQEEIENKQEALDKADFRGDVEKERKLLEEQQKGLTDRGQKLQDAITANIHEFVERVKQANKKRISATNDSEWAFHDIDQRNAVIASVRFVRDDKLTALDRSCREAKDFCERAVMKFNEPRNRAELVTVFNGISDTEAGVTGFFRKKKDDTAFQNMKTAVVDYLRNGGVKKAEKAYGECRNYLAGWMDKYGELKKGSKTENIRNQGMVRMLELMEKMPDFQSSLANEKRYINSLIVGDDWDVVEDKADVRRYKRMNFESLESSLAEHAEKSKHGLRHVGNNGNSRSFTDLDKRIAEKKAKARAAQAKAAAKAAKDAAKAAKAAKKAKAGKAK